MAKPAELPRWAQTALGALAANISDPVSGQKDTGFALNQTPTSGNVNWFWNTVYQWIKWVDDGVWTAVSLVLTGLLTGVQAIFTSTVSATGYKTAAWSSGTKNWQPAWPALTYVSGTATEADGAWSITATAVFRYLVDLPAGTQINSISCLIDNSHANKIDLRRRDHTGDTTAHTLPGASTSVANNTLGAGSTGTIQHNLSAIGHTIDPAYTYWVEVTHTVAAGTGSIYGILVQSGPSVYP